MPTLTNKARPAGQSEEYRFFTDTETGKSYKSKVETDVAPSGQPVLKISLSEVDPDTGTAIDDGSGEPVVAWQSHTLTDVDMLDPNFDPQAIASMALYSLIQARAARTASRAKVDGLMSMWKGKAALKLEPPADPIPAADIAVVDVVPVR